MRAILSCRSYTPTCSPWGYCWASIVLALDKQFQLSEAKQFTYFFWFYNAGIAITVLMMLFRGTQTVLGNHVPEAVSWIAGLGHIILTVGLILLVRPARQAPQRAREDRARGPGAGEDLGLNCPLGKVRSERVRSRTS